MGERVDLSDLEPIREEFPYRGKTYALVEPTADVMKKYKRALLGAVTAGPDGKMQSVNPAAAAEADLPYLAACLVEVTANGSGGTRDRAVPLKDVLEWPDRVTQRLLNRLNELVPLGGDRAKGQGQESEGQEKNS